MKKEMCKAMGVRLVVVDHTVPYLGIEKFLRAELGVKRERLLKP